MNPPFDIYAGLFSVNELAASVGISRTIIDVWVTRGVISPTRRESPKGRKTNPRTKTASRQGRPLFSCRDIFKAILIRTLAGHINMGSTDSSKLVGQFAQALLPESIAVAEVASGGEWMWACARSIERGAPLVVYGYATQSKGKWQFDMHVGDQGAAPRFGWDVPHVYVPMSVVFREAYGKCLLLLGHDETTSKWLLDFKNVAR